MARPLAEQVIVLTGASSGIGRESALRFARQKARLVLASRGEEALRTLAAEVERLGGEPHVVVTDVAEWPQVEQLADEALRRFGRIDTWVNDAATSVYGRFVDLAPGELERVVAVDLLGTMYGTLAALRCMRRQGAGTVINVASVLAEVPIQLQTPYVASKHGVRGFTEALRMELETDGVPVRLTLVLPASVDTPFFAHARSHTSRAAAPIPPVYEPRTVAEAIERAAILAPERIVVGGAGKALLAMERLSPKLVRRWFVSRARGVRQQQADAPPKEDNLFSPLGGPGEVQGEFGRRAKSVSVWTRAFELHPARKKALAALATAASAALVVRALR